MKAQDGDVRSRVCPDAVRAMSPVDTYIPVGQKASW